MAFQEPGDLKAVFRMLLLPQGQCLQPLEEEPRIERAQSGTHVAQHLHARLEDKGDVAHIAEVAEDVPELEAVVARVGLREFRELAVSPVEFAPVDDDSAYGRAVAAYVLRRRCGKDVRPVIEGPYQTDADRVVDYERNARVMGYLRERLEIGHVELGIADGLRIDRPRPVRDRLLEFLGLRGVDELYRASQLRESVVQKLVSAAVEVVCGDDLVPHLRDRKQRKGIGRLAGGDGKGAGSAFDGGDAPLEDIGGRVHDARIDIPQLRQGEEIGGVGRISEYVRSSLVNGHCPGPGCRVGAFLPRMNCQCVGSSVAIGFSS